MLKRRAAAQPTSHEDIFIQRYRWLMGSALRLTSRDQEQAEDLVHDVFLHFTLDRPDLEHVQNLDGYLYAMLRNMHVSQIRRSARLKASSISPSELSISDYDFVADGLQAVEQRTQQVQEDLRRICNYACARKETSKAGAVLILRFFHGYYPEEIARVLHGTRPAADKWLQIARSEAKLYLSDPNALSFIGKNSVEPPISNSVLTTEDLVNELRNAIFKSGDEKCFTGFQLKEFYLAKESTSIDGRTLAHIVSCRHCLDEVNQLLGLPLLSARYPTRTLAPDRHKHGKDGGPGSGGASGGTGDGAGGDDFLTRSRRRKKRVLEHRPQQLRIAVNGFIVGSQDVVAEVNKQSISLKGEEKIGFVEIFSEQEVRLLFSNIEAPPDGPIEHRRRVELDGDRSLELTLDFAESWPNVHVVYHDPAFAAAESGVPSLESRVEVSTASGRAPQPGCPSGDPARDRLEVQGPTSRVQRLSTEGTGLLTKLRQRWSDFGLWTWDFGLLLRPATVTALFALILIAAAVFLYRRAPGPPMAADLLARAKVAEEAQSARTDQVLHRTISLEAKNLAGELVARQRIEVWHSGEKRITARRLYDDRGVLIAGDWRRADGVQTLYHHGAKPQLQLAPEKRREAPVTADSVWHLDPSAKDFSSLIGGTENAQVEETANAFVISYSQPQAESGVSAPIKASLTLSKSDLHATELTVLIRAKSGPGSTGEAQRNAAVEFHFMENRFERRPIDAVAPALFEPDAELISSISPTLNPKAEAPEAVTQPTTPVIATAALEVEVLTLLHQAGADLGEQVSVSRVGDGELKVQGLVDSDKRKSELLAALSSVSRNPAVKSEIRTVAEATVAADKNARRNPKSTLMESVTVERVEAERNAMAAGPDLRRYFGGDDEQARRFALRMINRSHVAMRHAGALKRLLAQFSPQDLRELSPEARAKWMALIRSHANAFQAETAALRQELQPIFFASAPQSAATDSATITNDAELARAVSRLFDLGSANDDTVSAAFSSSGSSAGATISSKFWGLLKSAESLAAAIQKAR